MSECVYPQPPQDELAGPQLRRGGRKKAALSSEKTIHHHRCQQRGAREGWPGFQVRTARSKTASRSIDWALFSIQTEWRRNAVRIRVCRNVENVCSSSKSQSTRINCIHWRTKHPGKQTQKQHPDARIKYCHYKDNGNNAPDSKCEPRERKGQETLPRASIG